MTFQIPPVAYQPLWTGPSLFKAIINVNKVKQL